MPLQNAFGDLALDQSLQDILTELQGKLDAGGTVALDAATLTALENITATVTNTDFPDAATLAKLEQIRVLLASTLDVDTGLAQPLTDAQLRATPVPVSGTVTATTGGLTDTQLRATPVPISGTVTASGPLTNTELRATPVPVSDLDIPVTGQAGQTTLGNNILLASAGSGSYDTEPASGQSFRSIGVQIIPAGTIAGGIITFEGSYDNVTFGLMYLYDDKLNNGTTVATCTLATGVNRYFSGPTRYRYVRLRISTVVSGSGGSVQAISKFSTVPYVPIVQCVAQPSSLLIVQPPGLTKGTQSGQGFSTQDLKDAGRVRTLFSANAVAAGTTGTETAISLTKAADNGATSSAASFVITSAKRFRIQAINFCSRGHNTATPQVTTFNFRINTVGAVTTTSTPLIFSIRSATIASNEWDRVTVPIPDGWEILGDGTIQFGITANAVYTTNAPTWDVNIIGYEY